MFRILLESAPGEWKIVVPGVLLSHDAISTARTLSVQYAQAYRLEEYGKGLPESQEKKHYAMVLDPGVLNLRLNNIGS